MPDEPPASPLLSPCVGDCALDPATGWCLGCGRDADDLTAWRDLDDTARAVRWARLPARLEALGRTTRLLPWTGAPLLARCRTAAAAARTRRTRRSLRASCPVPTSTRRAPSPIRSAARAPASPRRFGGSRSVCSGGVLQASWRPTARSGRPSGKACRRKPSPHPRTASRGWPTALHCASTRCSKRTTPRARQLVRHLRPPQPALAATRAAITPPDASNRRAHMWPSPRHSADNATARRWTEAAPGCLHAVTLRTPDAQAP